MNKAGPWSGCPVSNPDPNNTIGLFEHFTTKKGVDVQAVNGHAFICHSNTDHMIGSQPIMALESHHVTCVAK